VGKHGVIVSAPGDSCDFVVRAFFPALGIPEDPVTGTTYTVLAPHYVAITGKSHFRARRLSARGGEVEATL
jgi:predicted PhzF superfamily epimerase YddE/YHI9